MRKGYGNEVNKEGKGKWNGFVLCWSFGLSPICCSERGGGG